jgi:hypothetical protein
VGKVEMQATACELASKSRLAVRFADKLNSASFHMQTPAQDGPQAGARHDKSIAVSLGA